MKKARISQLAVDLHRVEAQATPPQVTLDIDANPERGERGDFLKLTITMPAAMLTALRTVGIQRRARGQKNTTASELIREAVSNLISTEKP